MRWALAKYKSLIILAGGYSYWMCSANHLEGIPFSKGDSSTDLCRSPRWLQMQLPKKEWEAHFQLWLWFPGKVMLWRRRVSDSLFLLKGWKHSVWNPLLQNFRHWLRIGTSPPDKLCWRKNMGQRSLVSWHFQDWHRTHSSDKSSCHNRQVTHFSISLYYTSLMASPLLSLPKHKD